jgi:hypothetical protein
LRVLLAVVTHGGFTPAQIHLSVSAATISGQMAALEQRLGFRLCERGRAGFRLTEEGRAIHALPRVEAGSRYSGREQKQQDGLHIVDGRAWNRGDKMGRLASPRYPRVTNRCLTISRACTLSARE